MLNLPQSTEVNKNIAIPCINDSFVLNIKKFINEQINTNKQPIITLNSIQYILSLAFNLLEVDNVIRKKSFIFIYISPIIV